MKTVFAIMLAVSTAALLFILVRRRMTRAWLGRFFLHMAAAALLIYGLNEFGWISGVHIPLNPVTAAVIVTLGVPGIALIAGLQAVLI
jgi:inhibitor of the pro-sigma K processing machinery